MVKDHTWRHEQHTTQWTLSNILVILCNSQVLFLWSIRYVLQFFAFIAGAVVYLVPSTDRYQHKLLSEWLSVLEDREVPHTPGCSPVTTLGDALLLCQWQLDGLPCDFLSTENALLVLHSKCWPLFTDPQEQANHWIRNMVCIATSHYVCGWTSKTLCMFHSVTM
jgi:hypothetical protein